MAAALFQDAIVLYALNFHENLIEEEGITVTLMPAAKSLGVLRAEFDTPQMTSGGNR